MVRLACYNIEYCEGMRGRWWEYLQLWKLVRPPKNIDQEIITALKKENLDILALVEVDKGSIRAKKDEVRYIEKGLGMKHYISKIKYPLVGFLRLYHYIPILRKQANALISRYSFSNIKYHLLQEGTKRVIIEASVQCPKKVTLLLAHLALGNNTRKKQIEELTTIVNNTSHPVILMGDFNTYNGHNEIETLLDKTHLTDAHTLYKGSRKNTQPTYHPTRQLDYILVSPNIHVQEFTVLNYPYSDHKPVLIEFNIKKV